uniref:Uncharacterized protein n=1 Tax=Siphoviridae sp. ctuUw41 TaxID=2826503 RepID=A0A8S5MZD2_9CAUD|nr:MAG TPA: hypothetical protein [Siphoviridae sp. ctuUw41]
MITITENLNSKRYRFKDVKIGTLFKAYNELCLKISDKQAFNIDYCILEDINPERIVDYIIIEGELTVTNISCCKEGV